MKNTILTTTLAALLVPFQLVPPKSAESPWQQGRVPSNAIPLAPIVGTALAASSAWAQREERFNRTLDVGPDAALSIGNIAGDIHVEGGPGSSIVIDAVKSVEDEGDAELLKSVDIEVSQLGNRVRVSTEHTGRGRRHRDHDGNVSVSYRVKVPKGTEGEMGKTRRDGERERRGPGRRHRGQRGHRLVRERRRAAPGGLLPKGIARKRERRSRVYGLQD